MLNSTRNGAPILIAMFMVAGPVDAQTPGLRWQPLNLNDQSLDARVRSLAEQALTLPEEGDPATRVAARASLLLAAGRYDDALTSYLELRQLRGANPALDASRIYALASRQERDAGRPFGDAYIAAYKEIAGALDDLAAFDMSWYLGRLPEVNRRFAQRSVDRYSSQQEISRNDAVALLRDVVSWRASQRFWPALPVAIRADDDRRYIIDEDVRVRTPDGATVTGVLVRSRKAERQATLLTFTIYAREGDMDDVRRTAAHGYAGVRAFSRGKYHSPDRIVPWKFDGGDARALIDWIALQPWSDGRVGMYGGSYDGFTQWSVAKNPPKALRAIMPSAPTAPGIGGPMENNIFASYQYRWVPYVASGPLLDETGYNDMNHWRSLDREWYRSGRPYRDLDQIDGKQNPLYRELLDHPANDDFWKRLIPQGREFAQIDIPVLATTGYYDGALQGAQYFFEQMQRWNPKADCTLLIGPYSHGGAQNQSEAVVLGYQIDPVAQLDVYQLRYQWFDHVLKGAPRPALLKDRINYQVMGANLWRHAPTFEAMSNGSIRWYLSSSGADTSHRLLPSRQKADPTELTIDLADRSDIDWLPPFEARIPILDTHNALAFVSDPLAADTDITGLVRLSLDVEINKKDFDLVFRLYELDAKGGYLELGTPYMQRMSYLRDNGRRQLLVPNHRQVFEITKPGPVGRRVKAGHRLALVLGVQKQRDAQINYGTGKDVSDESIADASTPLRVRIHGESVLSVPVATSQSPD